MSPRSAETALLMSLALSLCALLAPTSLHAASADRQQPMDIDASAIDGTLADSGDVELSGDVTITQGSLDIRADTAKLTRADGEVVQVLLLGSPAALKQIDDAGNPISVRARQVLYRPQSNEVELSGAVEVDQPRGTMRGERIRYDMASGQLKAEGTGADDRIRMRIAPPSPSGAGER